LRGLHGAAVAPDRTHITCCSKEMDVPSKKRKKSAGGASLKPFYVVLGVLALGGVGWIAYSLAGGKDQPAVAPIEIPGINEVATLVEKAKGVERGAADAKLQVMVFSDFTCPACQGFSTRIEPMLRQDFIDNGKVRFVYHDFPLDMNPERGGQHRWGFIAARAARCAVDDDKFWEYHDVLFGRQTEWAYSMNTPTKELESYASQIGMDGKKFSDCLKSDKYADVVTANRLLGENLNVGSTPTIFIGSRSLGDWRNYEDVKQAIRQGLGES
jgi:protein-disulfide isomerase